MGFPRQEYWIGLPFLSPGDLPNPGIEPMSPALQADPLPSELPGKPNYTEIPVSKQNAATETGICLNYGYHCYSPQTTMSISVNTRE